MRQGYDGGYLIADDGTLIGISLGADHCAEHEWGIVGIRRAFGMQDDAFGLDRRRVRTVPSKLEWYASKKTKPAYEGIWFAPHRFEDSTPYGVSFYGNATTWTGWAEGDFGAFSTDAMEQGRLRELFDAIRSLDAAIWLGGGGVFQNAGLAIAIASRIRKEHVEAWDKTDREQHQLRLDVEAMGIEKKLRAAGRNWFALSPRRQADGSIKFWLNPSEQRENNCGWFTERELLDWAKGKGPIPKKKGLR